MGTERSRDLCGDRFRSVFARTFSLKTNVLNSLCSYPYRLRSLIEQRNSRPTIVGPGPERCCFLKETGRGCCEFCGSDGRVPWSPVIAGIMQIIGSSSVAVSFCSGAEAGTRAQRFNNDRRVDGSQVEKRILGGAPRLRCAAVDAVPRQL